MRLLFLCMTMVTASELYLEGRTWRSLWSWGLEPWQIEQWTGVANVSIETRDGRETPGPRVHPSGNNDIYLPSGCANGGKDSQGRSAYACPFTMLLSNDMIGAARNDGFEPTELVYAIAGAASDNDCGSCYQVQLLDAEREWRDDFPLLVVQSVNSGFDVMDHQLDIFMGAGGFGYFTACNRDCQSMSCQGGNCKGVGMYDTDFNDWTSQSQFGDAGNICYGGGIKWDTTSINRTELVAKCRRLVSTDNWRDSATLDSCVRSNEAMLHQNFVSSRVARVQCPVGLYELTGMRRSDDSNYPLPSLTLHLDQQCTGDRSQGHYCLTTMQDCCKVSCSWPGKTSTDPDYPFVDACLRDGTPIL